MMYQIKCLKNRGINYQKKTVEELTPVTISPNSIINTNKLIDGDIVDDNNSILTGSIWREKSVAGVLIMDKMYGKEKKKWLYKCIPYNKCLPVFLVPYEENSRFRMGSKTFDFDFGASIHWFVYDKFNYRLVTKQINTKVSKNLTVVEYRQRWDCTDE